MSYILQGSGTLIGPCLGNLLVREVGKVAPCVCLRCANLLDKVKRPPGTQTNRMHQYHTTPFPATPLPMLGGASSPPPHDYLSSAVKHRYTTDMFRQKYYTSFTSQIPVLGIQSPMSVNLNFTCGPDIVNTGIQYRFLHTTPLLEKEVSSKLEETVQRLRDKQNETLSEISKVEDLEKKIQNVIEQDEELSRQIKVSVEQKKQLTTQKKSIWQRFVDECKHYYSGFKLLFLDVKVSSKIIWKVLHGKTLSRRENRQLVRTVSDLFRLVPFSVFIIVPFMELLLPVALKLFPGMLPSTFTSQDEREVKMRRALKAKLEYAKFLQQTLDQMGPKDKGFKSNSARDFVNFYQQTKTEGTAITNKDILKFSKLFEDEITLDNMTRGQLVALCRLLELTPIGTNAFLRFQLEMQLRKLRTDDKLISREGIENMNVTELQLACKERGMRALGLTKERLLTQLKQWIELSTNEKVPPSLLLLSRTLYLPDSVDPVTNIAAAVGALPDAAATKAKMKIGEREGKVENVTRLEVIMAEQKKIEEEDKEAARQQQLAQQEKERLAKLEKQALEKALEKAIEEPKLSVTPPPATSQGIVTEAVSILKKATVSSQGDVRQTVEVAGAPTLDDIHVGHIIQEVKPAAEKEKSAITKELSAEDLSALKNALEGIVKEKGRDFVSEHDSLQELQQELLDYEEDLDELKQLAEKSGRKHLNQSKGAARLFSRVNKMLNNLNSVVGRLEDREKSLESQIGRLEEAGVSATDREGHLVTVQELLLAVKGLKDIPDTSRLERIGEVVASMDDDSDGIVKIEHVNKVIELLGRDNVNLNTKQVKNIIDLLGKEEMLEVEKRIEKLLGKIPSTEALEAKLAEAAQSELLVDKAKDLSEESGEVAEHIEHLFTRPAKTSSTVKEETDDNDKDNNVMNKDLQITKISSEQLKGISGATVRNAEDLALLTREQELAALSARKILQASNSEVQLLERAEDALQQRIREEASKDSQRIVVDSEVHHREDNSVKELSHADSHKDENELHPAEEKAEKVPRKNGTNH